MDWVMAEGLDTLALDREMVEEQVSVVEDVTPVDGEAGDVDGGVDEQPDYPKRAARKGIKGINQFSCCDRATQTTVAPIRVSKYNNY